MSSIGDVIHALPIARLIKRHDPEAFIGWVVRKRCADLLDGNPDVDRVYVIPNRPKISDLLALRTAMRSDRYDLALDLQGLLLSGIVTWLSGIRRRVGLDLNREGNRMFLTEPTVSTRDGRSRHAVEILRGFLPVLGIDSTADWPRLDYLGEGQTIPGDLERASDGKRIALNVGASSIYKQWPVERWAALATQLTRAGFVPIVIGGSQDVEAAESVVRKFQGDRGLVNLAGRTTLRQLAAVLTRCEALVTADTGPMHLAAGIGVPVVALFGPTDPNRTGPYGDLNSVIWKQLECSPCFRRPTCNGRVDCMNGIVANEVLQTVQDLLTKREAAQAC